jgi:hypothetical protein
VKIDKMAFAITENSLNLDSPELEIHVGPITVTDRSHEDAEHVGWIRSVPAMSVDEGTIDFVEGGQAVLEEYMSNFKTPFHVVITGHVRVQPGDPVPAGRLEGYVTATAHAGL